MATFPSRAELDAAYRPFPSFEKWPGSTSSYRLFEAHARLQAVRASDPGSLARAMGFALRAAAFDTGALERLYETDRGLTYTVALQAATWQSQVSRRNADALGFFKSQLSAYELVLDAVTRRTPISEAWIRSLHACICATQEIYGVHTAQGFQEQALPKGSYKTLSNHVLQPDGTTYSFAPVDDTAAEVHRFVLELRSPAFEAGDAVCQAAWAHYALVRIHPFADGNGRVARALASLFSYRHYTAPLIVFADQRERYLQALKEADDGDLARFNDFISNRLTETLELVAERFESERVSEVREPFSAFGASEVASAEEKRRWGAENLLLLTHAQIARHAERNPGPHLDIALIAGPIRADQPLVLRISGEPGQRETITEELSTRVFEVDAKPRVRMIPSQASIDSFEIDLERALEPPDTFFRLKLSSWVARLIAALTLRIAAASPRQATARPSRRERAS